MKKKDRVLKASELGSFGNFEDEFELTDGAFLDEFGRISDYEILDDNTAQKVTIIIKDEKTGREKRIAGVRNVLIFFQDNKQHDSWGQMVVGDLGKISEVVAFLSKASSKVVSAILSPKKGGKN